MKKITLLVATLVASSSLFSQSTFKWNGNQPDQVWDYATANWLDPAFPIPLPKTFIEGSSAIFDETSTEGSDTLKINGVITVADVNFSGAKDYVLRSTSTTTDELTGSGTLTKEGTGTVVMDLKNTMAGGTVIKAGKLMMEKQTTANIFGSKIVAEGGIINLATTSSGSYVNNPVPIEIPEGDTATIECSRYSYFTSPISGSGVLNLVSGGERCMIGSSKSGSKAEWDNFTGDLIVGMHSLSSSSVGYHSFLMPSTKTYDYTDMSTIDSLLINKKVTLKAGAGLTGCSGTRCWAIGELQAEDETSFLGGYSAGNSNSPRVYWMFGMSNTDVVFPGSINDSGSKGYNYVGLIKAGTGKYTFTSTKSITTASLGVQVMEGTFIVDIPVTDTTTALGRVSKSNALTINAGAIGGGNGRLTGKVQVDSLGTLVIGNGGIGELVLADTLSGNTSSPLVVKNGGKIIFKVADKNNFDKLSTSNSATFNGGTILIKPASSYALNDGDSITILTTQDRISETDSFKLETEGFAENLTITAVTDTIAGAGSKITLVVQGSAQAVKTVTAKNVSVYPNPSVGDFNFTSLDSEIKSIDILNLQGQIVRSEYMNSKSVNLNLNSLPKGIYYSKINTANGTKVQKIILK